MKIKKRIIFIGFIVGVAWAFLLKLLTSLPPIIHWLVLINGAILLGILLVWIIEKREKRAKK